MQLLLNKVYSAEELADVERDVSECFSKIDTPVNNDGFFEGSVKVTIVYDEQRETLEDWDE